MLNRALASIAFEVGDLVGDTNTTFLTRVKRFLNNRYSEVLMRSCATQWTMASLASLGDSSIPTLGMGEVIQEGATADAWRAKRNYSKGVFHDNMFEKKLGDFIISGDYNRFNVSLSRYLGHDE
jgi:hypothetical protein